MKTLYWKTSKNKIPLKQAVQECFQDLADAVGLIYSPQKCSFIKIKSGKIEQPPIETPVDLKLIFEARIFNQQVELRWLNERNGEGKAVLLSEDKDALNLGWNQLEKLEAIAIQSQQYILWGQSKPNSEVTEWSQLFSNRIGSLYVPCPCSNVQNRVYLKTCEYFKADDYGNVSVVEERLIALEVK